MTQTTVCRDSMRLESPAAQAELVGLLAMKVGDVRKGVLLPALDVGMEWTLVVATPTYWEFVGRFFGQPMYRLIIRVQAALLTLDVEATT